MQRKKSREELLHSKFLSKTDIAKLLNVSWKKACKIYELANKIDSDELGEYRIETTKVRKNTVFKVYGIRQSDLKI